jgi:hypothetical protein
MRIRALVVALAALACSVAPSGAQAFMRPTAPATQRFDGKWACTTPYGTWDVNLVAEGAILKAPFVGRGSSSGTSEALGLVRDGKLLIAIADEGGGIGVYRFAGDGTARAEYSTYAASGHLGEELLSGGPSGDVVGSYDWIATSASPNPTPLGAGGRGKLDIRREGDVYRFDWHNSVTGVGLRSGARIVVAWGSRMPHEVFVLSPAPNGLRGELVGDSTPTPLDVTFAR